MYQRYGIVFLLWYHNIFYGNDISSFFYQKHPNRYYGIKHFLFQSCFYNSAQTVSSENETNSIDIHWAKFYPFTTHNYYPIGFWMPAEKN